MTKNELDFWWRLFLVFVIVVIIIIILTRMYLPKTVSRFCCEKYVESFFYNFKLFRITTSSLVPVWFNRTSLFWVGVGVGPNLQNIYCKWAIPGIFFVYFRLSIYYKQNITFLQPIKVKISIQYMVVGFEATTFRTWISPITTRPGL